MIRTRNEWLFKMGLSAMDHNLYQRDGLTETSSGSSQALYEAARRITDLSQQLKAAENRERFLGSALLERNEQIIFLKEQLVAEREKNAVLETKTAVLETQNKRLNKIVAAVTKGSRKIVKGFKETVQELLALSAHDHLTGLHNRRNAEKLFEMECARTDRTHEYMGVLIIDVDHFKKVNDLYGHPAGDAALQHLAKIIGATGREYDTAFRWGGEEFGKIVPTQHPQDAALVAERIRAEVEKSRFKYKGVTIPLTVSIGVYVVPREECTNLAEVVGYADKGLYAAKANGRNSVYIVSDKGEKIVPYEEPLPKLPSGIQAQTSQNAPQKG